LTLARAREIDTLFKGQIELRPPISTGPYLTNVSAVTIRGQSLSEVLSREYGWIS